MNVRWRRFVLALALALAQVAAGWSAATADSLETGGSQLWSTLPSDAVVTAGDAGRPVPERFLALRLDETALARLLQDAPREIDVRAGDSDRRIVLPMPDGSWLEFSFVEAPVMAPELAARYPQIRTYLGRGVEDAAVSVRFDLTPHGFHAQILSPGGAIYIDPVRAGDTTRYASYHVRDQSRRPRGFECLTGSEHAPDPGPAVQGRGEALATGETLRTYRLACAATGEYTIFHGGTVVDGQAAVVTAINRVTGIFENDMSIRLVLIANNDSIIYTNPATDPYTNSDTVAMLAENESNLNSVIGSANYDIGHVLSTGPGGIAFLQGPCGALKARGNSGTFSPTGDPFHVSLVAHEMGHQFGASHSFNGVLGSCGANRSAGTAYEPGSGSTIMSYAGICSSDNLQSFADPYYHVGSLDQMINFTQVLNGSVCPVATTTGNTPPVVDAGFDYTIPAETPFVLTAVGSDSDGDIVTYAWEEFDLGPPAALTLPDEGSIPLFRTILPTTDPVRPLPRLSDVLSHTFFDDEKLPVLARTMTFRVTARDNRSGGGGIAMDTTLITVEPSAGPFRVTAPTGSDTWLTSGTVSWNVAGSDLPPVSATLVDILLSTDGGLNFDTVLVFGTANDGSEFVDVSGFQSTSARIRVQASGNIFYDINPGNFSIAIPDLSFESSVLDDSLGNGNGGVDPDEWVEFLVELRNDGLGVATGVSAILSTTTPGVTVVDGQAFWSNVLPQNFGTSLVPHFAFAVDGSVPCGTIIDFDLAITTNEGAFADSFQVIVGTDSTQSFDAPSADTPQDIPDNNPQGIVSSITVTDSFTVQDVVVTVDIVHADIGDLEVDLTSPGGTTVSLHDRSGAGVADLMTSYPAPTLPDGPGTMGDFTGDASNGVWSLEVADRSNGVTGTLNSWSLSLIGSQVLVCEPVTCFVVAAATATPDAACDGSSATLDAASSAAYGTDCTGGLDYRFEEGGLPIQDWSSDPDLVVTPAVTTSYTVRARELGTLAEDQVAQLVTVLPVPTAAVTQVPDPVCIELDALELDAGPGFASYLWRDDGDQVVGTDQLLALGSPACGRVYSVEVSNPEACTDVALLQVSCIVCEPAEVSPAGSSVPFLMDVDGAGTVEFELVAGSNVTYHLYTADTIAEVLAGDWTNKYCDLESSTLGTWSPVDASTVRWTPLIPGILFPGNWVVVAEAQGVESTYGVQSSGSPRPKDADAAGSVGNFGCP